MPCIIIHKHFLACRGPCWGGGGGCVQCSIKKGFPPGFVWLPITRLHKFPLKKAVCHFEEPPTTYICGGPRRPWEFILVSSSFFQSLKGEVGRLYYLQAYAWECRFLSRRPQKIAFIRNFFHRCGAASISSGSSLFLLNAFRILAFVIKIVLFYFRPLFKKQFLSLQNIIFCSVISNYTKCLWRALLGQNPPYLIFL
jgi:hypothetical protein